MARIAKHAATALAGGRDYARLDVELDRGPGAIARIGLIALANDVVIEGELRRILGERDIGLYVTRLPVPGFGTVDALAGLGRFIQASAQTLVPGNHLDVVAFGCTSAAALLGRSEFARLVREGRGTAVACVDPMSAAIRSLAVLGARRIAVICPYVRAIADEAVGALASHGVEVVRVASFEQPGDARISRISPRAVLDAALAVRTDDCDALFISCTALRVASVIASIEDAIERPVVTSNQALLWEALSVAGAAVAIDGYGALLSMVGRREDASMMAGQRRS